MESIISLLHDEACHHFPAHSINVCVDHWRHYVAGVREPVKLVYSVSIMHDGIVGGVLAFRWHAEDDVVRHFEHWCYSQKESQFYEPYATPSSIEA